VFHEYRLLDDCEVYPRWLGGFGVDYLSRRILRTDLNLPLGWPFIHIQPIAARLAREDDEAVRHECYTSYVKLLCTKAVRKYHFFMANACLRPANPDEWNYKHHRCDGDAHDRGFILLAAAVCTNKLSIIEAIIADERGHHNSDCCWRIFGDPIHLAVDSDHSAALDLLFSRSALAPSNKLLARVCRQDPTHLATVQKLLELLLPKWNKTYLRDDEEKTYLEIDNGHNMYEVEAALETPSVEAFKLIMRVKESTAYPNISESKLGWCLAAAARNGWYAMARHLLDLGASPDGKESLKWASQYGHSAIVHLLLDHGASITGYALSCAAKKGRWDMVRLLVARGGDINSGDPTPLIAAVAFERADMVRELISLGARVDGEFGRKAITRARDDGLESMLVFLEEIKVEDL